MLIANLDAGTYQPSISGRQCLECGPGQYSHLAGQSFCSICASGRYQATPRGTSPTCNGTCHAGYFWCGTAILVCMSLCRCSFAGSGSATQSQCGSHSSYCPVGSESPLN